MGKRVTTRWEGRLAELNRRIAEAELITTALTQTALAVIGAGGDAGEALERLLRQIDGLGVLRLRRALFERFAQAKVRAARRCLPTEIGQPDRPPDPGTDPLR